MNVEPTILSSTDIVLPYVFKVTIIVFWLLAFKGSEDAIGMGRPFAPLARTVGVGVVAAAWLAPALVGLVANRYFKSQRLIINNVQVGMRYSTNKMHESEASHFL